MAKKTGKKQATTTGQYDRLFKENAEEIYVSLIKALLHIDTRNAQDLPQSDLQRTIERKADFLKKMWATEDLPAYALHIEIQSDNDKAMHKRILLYHALIFDTYDLDSLHYVIYIGDEPLNMPTEIRHMRQSLTYEIIDIKRYDYEDFLQASTPEEVILAILGNFHGEQPATVIEKILQRLRELAPTSLAFGKYTTQLEIISQLRNLRQETLNRINTMPVVFDITQTMGYEAATKANIEKMLSRGKLKPAQIADILEVPLERVLEIQEGMAK